MSDPSIPLQNFQSAPLLSSQDFLRRKTWKKYTVERVSIVVQNPKNSLFWIMTSQTIVESFPGHWNRWHRMILSRNYPFFLLNPVPFRVNTFRQLVQFEVISSVSSYWFSLKQDSCEKVYFQCKHAKLLVYIRHIWFQFKLLWAQRLLSFLLTSNDLLWNIYIRKTLRPTIICH